MQTAKAKNTQKSGDEAIAWQAMSWFKQVRSSPLTLEKNVKSTKLLLVSASVGTKTTNLFITIFKIYRFFVQLTTINFFTYK